MKKEIIFKLLCTLFDYKNAYEYNPAASEREAHPKSQVINHWPGKREKLLGCSANHSFKGSSHCYLIIDTNFSLTKKWHTYLKETELTDCHFCHTFQASVEHQFQSLLLHDTS